MRRTRKARVVTAKIIEFPGQWWRAPKRPCEGVFSNAALTLVIGPADDSSPQCSAFMSADETLADLHRLIIQHFGWDDAHNYFFSQGCDRYEDPLLFATQDRVSARCRRIYCAADVPLSRVFNRPEGTALLYLRAAEWPRAENRPRRHRRLEAIRLSRPAASRRAAAPTLPCA